VIRRGALLLVALAVGCGAAGGTSPHVSLRGPAPSSLVAGQPWIVRVSGAPVSAVCARSGGRVVSAPARRSAPNAYVARLTLPAGGVWHVVALTGRTERPLARVRVLSSYPLALPAQVLADEGSLLVVERLGRDRVLRVDLATGRLTVLTRAVPAPWGLARAADGGVLVSGASGIYSLRGGPIASVRASPITAGDGDDVYFANENEVGRVHAGDVSVLTTDVDAPHGLFVDADGALVVSDSGHGRVIRVDPSTGEVRVVAAGLEQGLGAIDDDAGGALVVEFGAGRLVHLRPDGTMSIATEELRKPYALARAADGPIYVVEDGELDRPSGGLARVAADGSVTRLRLVPGWPAT
jgi:hypothetical protein